jgi:hypothetical protein
MRQKMPSGSVSTQAGSISRTHNESISTPIEGPASVTVQLGLTLNMGNYQMARIDVGASIPCKSDELDAAYTTIKRWAEDKLRQEASDVVAFTIDLKRQAANL